MRTKPFVPPPARIVEVAAPPLPQPPVAEAPAEQAPAPAPDMVQPVASRQANASPAPQAPQFGPYVHESVILGGNTFEPVRGPLAYVCREAVLLTRQGVPWVILAEDDTILLRLLEQKMLEGKEEYRIFFQTLEQLLLLEMIGAMRTAYEGILADIKPSARKKDVMDHVQTLCDEMKNVQSRL